jgi:phosphoglycolate phosphatase-like HAD superfamily hydrolase
MSLAFEELFGHAGAFNSIQLSGRTDAWLLFAALDAHGIARDDRRVHHFPAVYLQHLEKEIGREAPHGARKGILPGVRALLDALGGISSVHRGLLTGNYERAAQMKLEHFDLWKDFSGGAFGDDAPDRNALLARAITRITQTGGPAVTPADVVIVGDTPFDVEVAQRGGARSIAVATGRHTVEELREAGADDVFDDLSDTQAVLQCLSLVRGT